MNTTTTTQTPNIVSPDWLTELRDAFVGALGGLKISGKAYAQGLLDQLGTAWITMAHDEKGEAGDAMRAERDALYAALRANGHSNPSVKWKQIKDHAREIIEDAERAERIAAGEEPEPEEKGGARHTRTPQLRYVEDLTGLFKMGKREMKTLTDAQKTAHGLIVQALSAIGVDTTKL